MTLEHTLETRACAYLFRIGANPIKRGQDSEPDREVLWGGGHHFWIEFKKEKTGRIRPGQETYAKYLRSIGDSVYFVESFAQIQDIIETHFITWGEPTAKRDAAFGR